MTLQLIPSKPEYAEKYLQWREEAFTQKHNPVDLLSLEECRNRLSTEGWNLKEIWITKSFKWFLTNENSELIGNVSLKNINPRMLSAEIAYGIGEAFQNKGLGSKAVQLLVTKLFEESQVRRLYALVAEQNLASRRILEKTGFKQEGILREHYLINGIATHEVFYGILRNEFCDP